jgi:hypothetical protein
MQKRTVKILGWGLQSTTAIITALIDNELVFTGTVDLVEKSDINEPMETAPTLLTLQIPMEFSGIKKVKIFVEEADVIFGYVVANYADIQMGGIRYSSGSDIYLDVAEFDSDHVRDPRSNVYINGKLQSVDRKIGKGTWQWPVNAWSCFSHDLSIDKPGLLEK